MSLEALGRLFGAEKKEPGQGLKLVTAAAARCGGSFLVSPRPGGGTSARLRLPLSEGQSALNAVSYPYTEEILAGVVSQVSPWLEPREFLPELLV